MKDVNYMIINHKNIDIFIEMGLELGKIQP